MTAALVLIGLWLAAGVLVAYVIGGAASLIGRRPGE